jgi:hypothetical protein
MIELFSRWLLGRFCLQQRRLLFTQIDSGLFFVIQHGGWPRVQIDESFVIAFHRTCVLLAVRANKCRCSAYIQFLTSSQSRVSKENTKFAEHCGLRAVSLFETPVPTFVRNGISATLFMRNKAVLITNETECHYAKDQSERTSFSYLGGGIKIRCQYATGGR